MDYQIFPPEELIDVSVQLPLSKSISNRALIINALTPGADRLERVAVCDDTDVMVSALASQAVEVNVGAAGTAMRFLTAYFACRDGRDTVLDGSERMRHRPIGVLVDALRQLGADIQYMEEEGFPPLKIHGRRLSGGTLRVPAAISSQFISALMMVAPTMREGLRIELQGEAVSRPYITMTAGMMEQAGAQCEVDFRENLITVGATGYSAPLPPVEADWSAASYWYEIEALSSGFITLPGLELPSLQGDSRCREFFGKLGVSTEEADDGNGLQLLANPDQDPKMSLNLSDTPDIAQTIAVTCSMLGIPFTLSGLESLRIKETDRISALYNELLKIGTVISTDVPGTISWDGTRRPITEMPAFDTYEDHRMAMAFAPVALYIPGICIRNAQVVSKSYPGFWENLICAGFNLIEVKDAD